MGSCRYIKIFLIMEVHCLWCKVLIFSSDFGIGHIFFVVVSNPNIFVVRVLMLILSVLELTDLTVMLETDANYILAVEIGLRLDLAESNLFLIIFLTEAWELCSSFSPKVRNRGLHRGPHKGQERFPAASHIWKLLRPNRACLQTSKT